MDIEKLATAAVVESISLTDVLSPFINDGDKEPSWDGNIYIYQDKSKTKKGIKKVPVQVKGEVRKVFPPKGELKFRASVVDLDNWLADGGVILFVVLLDESGKSKSIYYSALLPVKIRYLKESHPNRKTVNIPLILFPNDNDRKVSVLLDFYDHMQKQTSFANSPLYSIEELESEGVLENVSFYVTTYGKHPTEQEIETIVLQNGLNLYANVKGSPIPHPLPGISTDVHIAKDIHADVVAGGNVFYQNYRVIRFADGMDILIGKSTVLKNRPGKKKSELKFKLKGMLSDYIRDTEFLIALIENKSVVINGATISFDEMGEIDVEPYKNHLAYYRDVKKMLDLLGVKKELNCEGLTEQDETNIRNFTNALVYGKPIRFKDFEETVLYGRYNLGNLVVLIWANKQPDGSFCLQSYFSDHRIAAFEGCDENKARPHPISQYVFLKKDDFLDAANIDYRKIVDDLDKNEISTVVTDQITLLMLEMLKAYDEQTQKDHELLATAERYCDWLTENSEGFEESMTLNRLQIIKRQRDFTQDEISTLLELRKSNHSFAIRCGANLLLGKAESSQDCFDEMEPEEKAQFITFPICHFGNLTYNKAEE